MTKYQERYERAEKDLRVHGNIVPTVTKIDREAVKYFHDAIDALEVDTDMGGDIEDVTQMVAKATMMETFCFPKAPIHPLADEVAERKYTDKMGKEHIELRQDEFFLPHVTGGKPDLFYREKVLAGVQYILETVGRRYGFAIEAALTYPGETREEVCEQVDTAVISRYVDRGFAKAAAADATEAAESK
jgi:hypothetical protein